MPITVEVRGAGDTRLRAIVAEGYSRLVEALAAHGRELPRFVDREVRAYLGCGDPANGFAWLECIGCRHHRLVGPDMGVKASGGVRTAQDARNMVEAGANRLGASASVAIVTGGVGKSAY